MRDETRTDVGPYPSSWIDRVGTWVERLPLPPWTVYLGFGVVLVSLQLLFLSWAGGAQAQGLLPIILFNGMAAPFLLALFHLLDRQASAAVDAVGPLLDSTEPEIDRHRYSLSTMPFFAPLIAGLVATGATIATERVAAVPVAYAVLDRLPAFRVVFQIVDKSSAFLFGAFIYHTVRQLRLVNAITTDHLRVRLFQTGPLQAFSGLTASTSLGILAFVYGWMLISPEILDDPLILGYTAGFTILAALVFVWPLYGVHRRLRMEKARVLHEIDLRFEDAFDLYGQKLHTEDHSALQRLDGVISSLEIQHRIVAAVPTWPWRPEAGRLVLTAIALPLVLMVLQHFVERALR